MRKEVALFSLAITILIVLCLGFASSSIILNEIMCHTNNSLGDEWIEIYNPGSEDLEILNWNISDLLTTPSSSLISFNITAGGYVILVEESIDCSSLNLPASRCVSLNWLGSKLNDAGDSVLIYNPNTTLISNFSWDTNIKSLGKSFSFNSTSFGICMPTPGHVNNCSQSSQNNSQNNSNQNASDANNRNDESNSSIKLSLDWDDEDINASKTFYIDVKVKNLEDKDYDIKVWIEDDEDNILTEFYDDNEEKWRSGNYYFLDFFSGQGNRTEGIKLRLKGKYSNFSGEAVIFARLRHSDEILANYSDEIEILASGEKTGEEKISGESEENTDKGEENFAMAYSESSNAIKLGYKQELNYNTNAENSIIYKSKNAYIKEYTLYAFGCLSIILMIAALFSLIGKLKKKTKKKNGKSSKSNNDL